MSQIEGKVVSILGQFFHGFIHYFVKLCPHRCSCIFFVTVLVTVQGVGGGLLLVGNGREQSGRNGPKIEYNSIWRLAGVVKIAAVIGRLRRGKSRSEWTEFTGAEKCQRACH